VIGADRLLTGTQPVPDLCDLAPQRAAPIDEFIPIDRQAGEERLRSLFPVEQFGIHLSGDAGQSPAGIGTPVGEIPQGQRQSIKLFRITDRTAAILEPTQHIVKECPSLPMRLEVLNPAGDAFAQCRFHQRRGGAADLQSIRPAHFGNEAIIIGAVRHDGPTAGQQLLLILGEADIADPKDDKCHGKLILALDHGGQRTGLRGRGSRLQLARIGHAASRIGIATVPEDLGCAIGVFGIDDDCLAITGQQ
jgi:hypothetical protein